MTARPRTRGIPLKLHPLLLAPALLASTFGLSACGGGGSSGGSTGTSSPAIGGAGGGTSPTGPTTAVITANVDTLHSAELALFATDELALERQYSAMGGLGGNYLSALATLYESHMQHFVTASVDYGRTLSASNQPTVMASLQGYEMSDLTAFNTMIGTVTVGSPNVYNAVMVPADADIQSIYQTGIASL
jgi:hypothetical protein